MPETLDTQKPAAPQAVAMSATGSRKKRIIGIAVTVAAIAAVMLFLYLANGR